MAGRRFTKSSGNVFADLGFKDAAKRLREADARIRREIVARPRGLLDELFAKDATVHLERMGPDHWWLSVQQGPVTQIVNLTCTEGIIKASVEVELETSAGARRTKSRRRPKSGARRTRALKRR